MARRGWDDLSDTYRGRLERGGISRTGYERGESLSGARGHATTPERPERAESKPEYQSYRELRQAIVDLKQAIWGTSGKFSAKGIRGELRGLSRSQLERGRYLLDYMRVNQLSWSEMLEQYPELLDDGMDWVGHYH